MQVAQLPDFDGPAVFVAASTMNDLPIDELGVILTTPEDAGCPQDVAVWLTLDADGRIESESRFHQLDDLASCASGVAVPAGWWETLPVPDPIRTIPTGTLQVAGQSIDMYNSSAELDSLVAWGFGRFASAGLEAPTIQRITFYPGHVDRCEGVTGLIASDAIVFCFTSTTNCTGTECDAWEVWKRATVLHELGHAWLSANLTSAVRDDFLHRASLRAWTSAPEWGDRGVELAAETLAWGLVDEPYEVRRPLGTWECAELADLFEVLTGSPPDPMPVCPDGG